MSLIPTVITNDGRGERDFFMSPEQAKEWGVIDLIVEKSPAAVKATA